MIMITTTEIMVTIMATGMDTIMKEEKNMIMDMDIHMRKKNMDTDIHTDMGMKTEN